MRMAFLQDSLSDMPVRSALRGCSPAELKTPLSRLAAIIRWVVYRDHGTYPLVCRLRRFIGA
jgi:hypothetical protein